VSAVYEFALIVLVLVALIWVGAALWNVTGTGDAWDSLGGGSYAMDHSERQSSGMQESAEEREQDLQALLKARADRHQAREQLALEVEEQVVSGADAELEAEVRAHVTTRNERRIATGKEPLDIEAEVRRLLRDS